MPALIKAIVLYFYILPKESISKVVKNAFYFILKALFFLVIFNFLYLTHFPDSKGHMKVDKYDVMNWLA